MRILSDRAKSPKENPKRFQVPQGLQNENAGGEENSLGSGSSPELYIKLKDISLTCFSVASPVILISRFKLDSEKIAKSEASVRAKPRNPSFL